MEKLIELLNEYEKENKRQIFYSYNRDLDFFESGSISGMQSYGESLYTVISKKFGFIKRLVENDKIDFRAVVKNGIKTNRNIEEIIDTEDTGEEGWNKFVLEYTLMFLAISDTPIDDLIGYLK